MGNIIVGERECERAGASETLDGFGPVFYYIIVSPHSRAAQN